MRSRTRSLQSKKYTHKKRKRTVFVVIIWLLIVGALCTAVILFFRLNGLQIHEVQIAGNRTVDSTEVLKIAEAHLNEFKLWFIPNRSYFVYPSEIISSEIAKQNPRIGDVQLVRHKDILSINITERVPSAVVCRNEKCFFTDENAFIYSAAPEQSSKIYIEYDVPASNASTTIGNEFISPKQFKALNDLATGITKLGLQVTKIVIDSSDDLTISTKSDTDVLVRYAESYDLALSNLSLFLEKAKQQARSKKEELKMTSIDLRYGNSVFYK